MINICKLISTVVGIGYVRRGGGTIAALVCGLLWFLLLRDRSNLPVEIGITLFVTILGVWTATVVEKEWGKDSNKVVIDEVSGMCVSLLWVPVTASHVLIAFVLFRFFDILKPLFIRRVERLPGGWGVMGDDVLAGIYSNLCVQGLIFFNI